MIVCLSGLSRANRLETLNGLDLRGVVIDYALKETPHFLSKVDTSCWVVIQFEIKGLWNKYKYAFEEKGSLKLSRLIRRHGSLDSGRIHIREEIRCKIEAYRDWCIRYESYLDVVCIPRIPSVVGLDLDVLMSVIKDKCMPTLDFSEQDVTHLIKTYKYIGVCPSVKSSDLIYHLNPLRSLLRAEGTKLHGWNRGDKETVLKGLFWSISSPSWLTGEKYGNIYNYVGNLKLVLYNKKSSRVKDPKMNLKSKCDSLGIDFDSFLAEDRDSINLWNAHQWSLYAQAVYASTHRSRDEGSDMKKEKKKTQQTQLQRKNQDTKLASREAGIGYLRECNSCYLASQCPAFMEGSDCSISTRPRVDTPDDVNALLNRIIEIQGERVLFTAFAEKTQGMGLNPEVSKEMEVLTKIIKDSKEIMNPLGQDEVMIKAKGSGVISRLFGGYGREGGGSKPSQSERIIDVSPLEDKDE